MWHAPPFMAREEICGSPGRRGFNLGAWTVERQVELGWSLEQAVERAPGSITINIKFTLNHAHAKDRGIQPTA
jgi:hypothetical protein